MIPEPQYRARLLWLEGVAMRDIATAVGRSVWTIWKWRSTQQWPPRIPAKEAAKRQLIAFAAALWQDGVPRPTVAVLCEIKLKTLDTWRVRCGWTKRRPGLKVGAHTTTAVVLRQLQQRALQTIASAHPKVERTLPRWRCCDQVVPGLTCPTCGRRHPQAEAA
jgi:uncharacterized protein YjcR